MSKRDRRRRVYQCFRCGQYYYWTFGETVVMEREEAIAQRLVGATLKAGNYCGYCPPWKVGVKK